MSEFDAEVLSCTDVNGSYAVVLDRTAFFPEGGGQPCDTGMLGLAQVREVSVKNGIITHLTDRTLNIGERVHGTVDWDKRFGHMQSHSGEHIVSGLIHRKYGFDNVGFHIGSEDVTIDLNGTLDRAQLDEIEDMANDAVYRNVSITAEYPPAETLASLQYRSKLALTENVRIVTVEGCDVCACCAPHCNHTGEIGMI
ncbi:MAG: alanyl-tRNA editing protein, partial [Eubacteriales bacterium]